jgi:hypothetical protein
MRFRKIALALFACMALGALAANAAQAAQWTLGTTENQTSAGTKITGPQSVSCEKHGTSPNLTLTGTVGGAPLAMSATGIDCVEASIDSTAAGVAHSKGKLTFTDVTVSEPKNCFVANNELTTQELTDEVITDPTSSTVVFDRFFSDTGVFVEIEFTGAECALNKLIVPVKGSSCGESVHTTGTSTYAPNPSGTLTKVQTLQFGMVQQTTATSTSVPCKLTLGATAEATFTGVVDNKLAVTNIGSPFGADAP